MRYLAGPAAFLAGLRLRTGRGLLPVAFGTGDLPRYLDGLFGAENGLEEIKMEVVAYVVPVLGDIVEGLAARTAPSEAE